MSGLDRTLLVPGDCVILDVVVVVDAIHQRDLQVRLVVDAGGDISPPFLGNLHIAGLSLKQAQTLIELSYSQREIYAPAKHDFALSRCR